MISGDKVDHEVTRAEGARKMVLVNDVVVFEHEHLDPASLNNDIVALIGVLAFYPVLPETEFILKFEFSVSQNVEKALRRPYILPHVQVSSANSGSTYTPLKEKVLSYGGGIDSLAAHLLFPETHLVHESPLGEFKDIVCDLIPSITDNFSIVKDNLRNIFSVWGLPLWVSVYAASLLFSPRYIISGSEMTGTYLK